MSVPPRPRPGFLLRWVRPASAVAQKAGRHERAGTARPGHFWGPGSAGPEGSKKREAGGGRGGHRPVARGNHHRRPVPGPRPDRGDLSVRPPRSHHTGSSENLPAARPIGRGSRAVRAADPCAALGYERASIWGWRCGQLALDVDRRRPLASSPPDGRSVHRVPHRCVHTNLSRPTRRNTGCPHNPQALLLALLFSLSRDEQTKNRRRPMLGMARPRRPRAPRPPR